MCNSKYRRKIIVTIGKDISVNMYEKKSSKHKGTYKIGQKLLKKGEIIEVDEILYDIDELGETFCEFEDTSTTSFGKINRKDIYLLEDLYIDNEPEDEAGSEFSYGDGI